MDLAVIEESHLALPGVLDLRTTAVRNVQRFRGGFVVKAHRLLYHWILGLRVIKKKKKKASLIKPAQGSAGVPRP